MTRLRNRILSTPDDGDIYVVPVSGGKDSQMVLSKTVKKVTEQHGAAEVPKRVIALHHYTGIDHSLTYRHLEWMQDSSTAYASSIR